MSLDNLGASRSLNISGTLGPSTVAPNQPISSGLKRDLSLGEMARSHPELSEPPLPSQSGIQSFFGDMGQSALFRFNPQQSSTFLRRKKAPPVVATKSPMNPAAAITNSLVAGMNKITFGGFDKVSSGLDRLKTIVKPSEKDVLNPVKRFGTRKRAEKSLSPEKEKRRMSFKMPKRRSSEGGILDSPTSFIQRFTPKFEPPRSRLRTESTDDEGHISDSAVLRRGCYTDSPVSMTHRRLKSDMGSMLRQESSIREDTPTSAIDRVRETMTESESGDSSVEDLEQEENISQDVLGPIQFTPSVHHLAPLAPQHNVSKTSDSFYDLWKTFMYLITESRMGPSKIGLIDLSRYSHVQLEDGFLELADEIFNLSERYHWAWTQSLFFTRPVINHFFRNLINRYNSFHVWDMMSDNGRVGPLLKACIKS